MRTLKTSEAASALNVSPNTLRSWERRFGYPQPRRSPGRHRLYVESDITALRHVLASGLSISSASSASLPPRSPSRATLIAEEIERPEASAWRRAVMSLST